MIKPNFIVAGGMRCATGWIRQCLKEHPDIYMATKEPHYYDRNYEKGIDWYQSFFEDYQGEQVIGEKTATYLHYPSSSENIIETNPDMKIIICLRDPVERMFSHYSMFAETDNALRETGFIGSVKPDTDFVIWSRYAEQVKRYQEIVPSENLTFVIYEEKDADPMGFIQNLYNFIGVNPIYEAESAELRTKRGQFEHNHWFWGSVSKILLHPRSPASLKKMYSGLRPVQPDSGLNDSIYEELSHYFDDILTLEDFLGRKLDCWRTRQYVT
jgi:hypothetical protein